MTGIKVRGKKVHCSSQTQDHMQVEDKYFHGNMTGEKVSENQTPTTTFFCPSAKIYLNIFDMFCSILIGLSTIYGHIYITRHLCMYLTETRLRPVSSTHIHCVHLHVQFFKIWLTQGQVTNKLSYKLRVTLPRSDLQYTTLWRRAMLFCSYVSLTHTAPDCVGMTL